MGLKKICVIGCGSIGSLHVEIHSEMVGKTNVDIVDPSQSINQAYTKRGHRVYDNLHDVLSHDYDLYDICLPTYLHKDVINVILSRTNSNIICEKPLVLNGEELRYLIEKHKHIENRLAAAYVERFNESFIIAREWASRHKDPLSMKFIRRTKQPIKSEWLGKVDKGGSILLDLTIHDIDASVWFTDARFKKVIKHKINDSYGILSVGFDDGSTAEYISGWDLPQESEHGVINQFTISSGDEILSYNSLDNFVSIGSRKELVKQRFPYAYRRELSAVSQLRDNGSNKFPTIEQISESFKIIDAINREDI